MIGIILVLLVVFWLFGYGPFQTLSIPLFTIGANVITLWDLFIFGLVLSLAGLLPSPLREIAMVALLIWVLATLGVIAVAGLSSILVISIIAGLALFLLSGYRVV